MMLKRIPYFSLAAIACLGLVALTAQARPETTQPAPVAIAQTQSLAPLTLADLPDGFIEPPPAIAAQIQQQIQVMSSQIQQGGINPEDYFAFVHPQTMQVIVGFTGTVTDQNTFDQYVEQAQNPAMQAYIFNQIQERLKNITNVQIENYGSLGGFENLGDRAAGIQMDVQIYGTTFKTQMVTFRRANAAAFATLMYPQGQTEMISLPIIAQKINQSPQSGE